MAYLVEATAKFGVRRVAPRELGRIPYERERFVLTDERFAFLASKNFVRAVKDLGRDSVLEVEPDVDPVNEDDIPMEEVNKIMEVVDDAKLSTTPKKRGRKKKES